MSQSGTWGWSSAISSSVTVGASLRHATHFSCVSVCRELPVLEACRFVGAAGGVARAVRMSAGAREHAAIDDQVLLTYRTTVEPALEDLPRSRRIAGLRGQ